MDNKPVFSPIDLHVHTTASDGTLSPAELIGKAKGCGISTIAITDHDEVSGVKKAIREGAEANIKVIAGVELSVRFKKLSDIHLLGYFSSCEFNGLENSLAAFRKTRKERGKRIVQSINRQLESQAIKPLSIERLMEIARGAIGRPHISQMLIERGLAGDINEAFDLYLIPHNVPKHKLEMKEAIHLIKKEGGWAVLAHPHVLQDSPNNLSASESEGLVRELSKMGLDGLEGYYGEYDPGQTSLYCGWADKMGLFVTIGSDFHGFAQRGELGMFLCGSIPVKQIMGNLPFV